MSALESLIDPERPELTLDVESGEGLGVREFCVEEGLSRLFSVELTCVSNNLDIALDSVLGRPATFSILGGNVGPSRRFSGVVSHFQQTEAEVDGLSTYVIRIVPELWLLTQTRSYRVFQQVTDPDIALSILGLWAQAPSVRLQEVYKERRYRVQYGESDFVFLSRLLEDAGVSFYFDTSLEGASRLVLDDAPHTREARPPIAYHQAPNPAHRGELVTRVHLTREIKPGRYTLQDLDYRRPPTEALAASSSAGLAVERALERYHYRPGTFSFKAEGGGTPSADDRGAQRTDLGEGSRQVESRLTAARGPARTCSFTTSAVDLRPGSLVSFLGHPRADLAPTARLLVVASTFTGATVGDWLHTCEARFADAPHRPELKTPKPKTRGVESATVVGPSGQEIHTDEFGRVRVQFHWDRTGPRSEASSLWIPVNQPWGGTNFGALSLPRIGQEVLVDFIGADPDRPVIMGRVFTATNPTPYKLPKYQDVQAIRSASTPKLAEGVARSGLLGGMTAGGGDGAGSASPQSSPLGGGMPFSLDKIAELVTKSAFFKALSPDTQTHGWQGSELAMHDVQGQERVYLQAQKDFNTVVKNHQRAVIGHTRSQSVGTDTVREVGNKEVFRVGSDRAGKVGGEESVTVKGPIIMASMTDAQMFSSAEQHAIHSKRIVLVADETIHSEAKRHVFASDQRILLVCGTKSAIIMFKDGIVIHGQDVLINPGAGVAQAVADGKNIAQHLQEKKAADQARDQMKKEADAIAKLREMDKQRSYPLQTQDMMQEMYNRGFTDQQGRELLRQARSPHLDDR